MGNYSTKNTIVFKNVRLSRDAKHFEANPGKDMPAATYLNFYHGTKGGEDLPVDARVVRGAKLFSTLKKGDICIIEGQYELALGKDGKLRGRIHNAEVTTLTDLKGRGEQAAPPADEPGGSDGLHAEGDTEGMGPAFD